LLIPKNPYTLYMQIRLATEQDLPGVMAIVGEVIDEMAELGNPQWNRSYPKRDRFELDIENEALFIAVDDDQCVIGFVTLDDEQPPAYEWVEWTMTPPCLVMHRMAVAQTARGRGVARALEDFAVDLAQDRRCTHIRVDTNSRNKPMQAFLESRGYRYVGQIRLRNLPAPFICYEKLLGY